MATEQNTPVDKSDFAAPSDPSTSDDAAGIDLSPGEHYIGEITKIDLDEGYNGVVHIDGEKVKLNKRLRGHIVAALEGVPILYEKGNTEKSFTNSDGEEITYYDRSFRFPKGGD